MKTVHTLLSVLAFSLAGSAIAGGGPYPEPPVPTVESTKSRAEVMAEAREANRLGLLTIGEEDVRIASAEQEALIAEAARRAGEDMTVTAKAKNSARQ
jgi:hypothetical protein